MRRLASGRQPVRCRLLVAAAATAIAVSSLGARAACAQAVRREVATLDAHARDELRALIRRSLDSAGLASITLAVARDGEVLWEEGFGFADLAKRRPATPTTRYAIASITKPMTATAVMQLVEQGRIALDSPVDDYLGPMRLASAGGDRAQATVRRVLSHTSGLPLHYRFFYLNQPERPDLARTVSRYGRIVFPPGEVYSYSNLGYGLLGEVVARVAGTTYESYLRDHVFRPLGMSGATMGTGAGLANSALRYDSAHHVIPDYDFDHRAASAVWASARDLVRFGMFQLKRRPAKASGRWAPPITHSTIDRMQQVATPGDTASGYGFGWAIDDEFGVRRVRHTGSMPGVSAVLALYPDEGLAIAVLSNQHSALPARIASRLASASLMAAGNPERVRSSVPVSSVGPFTAPQALRGEWRGAVHTHEGTISIALRVDSTRGLVRLGDQSSPWTPLATPSFRRQLLGGQFIGTIPTVDARQTPHVILLSLQLRDERLRGWAAAYVTAESDNFALSSYAELARVPLGERAP